MLVLCLSFNNSQSQVNRDCIVIIGDSTADGSVVTIIPGYGFPVIKTKPFSAVLTDTLLIFTDSSLTVVDATVGASSLVTKSAVLPYFESEAFSRAIDSRCNHVVIFPFLNDLSFTTPYQAQRYIVELQYLIDKLLEANDAAQIHVISYYDIYPNNLTRLVYPDALAESQIRHMNQQLFAFCHLRFWNIRYANLKCVNSQQLFKASNHILRDFNQQVFWEQRFQTIDSSTEPWFTLYWQSFPYNSIATDGAHLSLEGKRILAEYIISSILELESN